MNRPNRDLMVMFKQELMSPQAMEYEVERLHELLYTVERLDNIVTAHEIIDLNKYKIFGQPAYIKNCIRNHQDLKPFVFLNNRN